MIGMNNSYGRCSCGRLMNKEIFVNDVSAVLPDNDGIFTKRDSYKFTLSDDLKIRRNKSGYIFQSPHSFGITDIYGAKQGTLHVGGNEIMDLLRALLLSRSPLTDVFLDKRSNNCSLASCADDTSQHIDGTEATSKMVLKIVLDAFTNKVLFARAGDDFVDFLFSLLTIPLGGVAHILGGETSLTSVDNLYKSVANFDIEHLKTKEMKSRLLEPLIPCMYLSESQILPIFEHVRKLYYNCVNRDGKCMEFLSYNASGDKTPVTIIDPKGEGCYVRRPGMFMVTDDLVVMPLSVSSVIPCLHEQAFALSDVVEREVGVGVEEALSILKASLTSTAVLTTVFRPVLKKQPKKV